MRMRALQLLSLDETMTITARKMCQRVAMVAVCILIPGWLAAQTDAAKSADGAKSTGQTFSGAANSGTSPAAGHDNTYVIGVDDVLAINVWKEAGCVADGSGPLRRQDLAAFSRRSAGQRARRLFSWRRSWPSSCKVSSPSPK